MKYRISIQKDEDGVFVAKCPSLPGCISQGKTREKVLTNIKDAISGYLQSLKNMANFFLTDCRRKNLLIYLNIHQDKVVQ